MIDNFAKYFIKNNISCDFIDYISINFQSSCR